MALADFPRHPLTFGPSPVHPLDRLSEHLGGARIWAKREDCNSGLAFGGNKTRKLEYLVPDALAQGADTLVSIGGYQSNHTRQVAAVAAHARHEGGARPGELGRLAGRVNDRVGNILLSRIMGAEVRLDPAGFGIGFKDSLEAGARGRRGARRYAVRHPGRRLRPPARRARLRELGRRGRAAGARARRLLRHDRRLLGDRVDPRRHDRRLRGPGPAAAPGDRHRRQREDRGDPRPGRADRPEHRGAHRPRPRAARRRDHRARGLGRRPLRHPGRSPRSTRSA